MRFNPTRKAKPLIHTSLKFNGRRIWQVISPGQSPTVRLMSSGDAPA
jgi:hypothetical protein